MLITIIGRGHSGTRAMSHTLSASGVYMGAELNGSGDLIPAEKMYEACRVMARHVKYLGNLTWDFSKLHTIKIDPAFEDLVGEYLHSVLASDEPVRGWKLPETTLVYPWITRLFPDIRYIFWIRDPRDSIIGGHLTDDLADFGIPYDHTADERERRAVSWKYQLDLVNSTPAPRHMLKVRFEDFVLHQEQTLARLEAYLDMPLARIEVRPGSIGRWQTDDGRHDFPFFHPALEQNGYLQPTPAG